MHPRHAHLLKNFLRFAFIAMLLIYAALLASSLHAISLRETHTPGQLARVSGKFLQVGEANVYYEYYPSINNSPRATLIFLHGFGASLLSWDNQIQYFQNKYNVLLVDMFGFGLSQDVGNSELGQEAQTSMLMSLMRSLAIPKAIFIGNSFGGGVAQRMALNNPEKVQGLILVDAIDLATISYLPSALSWTNSPLGLQIPVGLVLSKEYLEAGMKAVYGNSNAAKQADIDNYYLPFTVKNTTTNLIAQFFAPQSDRLVETGHITQPVLLIRGTKDQVISPQIFDNLKKGLPNREIAELPGLGHMPQLEDPGTFNQLVGNWLERHTI